MEPIFGDDTPDDVFTVGDEDVDYTNLAILIKQVEDIQNIKDDEERLAAAVAWARALAEVS